MGKSILIILVGNRSEDAPNVQKLLTGWGCFIKTRLGIHNGVLENCAEDGLIICELVGEKEKHEELARKLNLLKSVKAQLVHLELEKEKKD
ncbi:MAG: hypothetical protein N2517_09270 [Ignavibacteria bacterium]|nr:hypothetical protein [Ignavibacteria bacterium]